jgi:hypothetical protein
MYNYPLSNSLQREKGFTDLYYYWTIDF